MLNDDLINEVLARELARVGGFKADIASRLVPQNRHEEMLEVAFPAELVTRQMRNLL